ncbi:hypothetical protein [Clostridium perfringens]
MWEKFRLKLFKLEKYTDLLEYVLAFFIVANTYTIWTNKELTEKLDLIIILVCLILLDIFSLNNLLNKPKLILKTLILSSLLFLYNFIFLIFTPSKVGANGFIIMFGFILVMLTIYYIDKFNNDNWNGLILKISNIIFILATISLVFFVFSSILKLINPTSNFLLKWGIEREIPSYYNLYYETQVIKLGNNLIPRNTGIFMEAPIYNFVLSTSLIIELFLDNIGKFRNVKIVIILITILTTLSSTGIIVLTLILLFWFYFNNGINLFNKLKNNIFVKRDRKYIIITIFTLIIFLIVVLLGIILLYSKRNSESLLLRIDDYKVVFRSLKDSFLIGHGYWTTTDQVVKYSSFNRINDAVGLSTGIGQILIDGGIYLAFMYFFPFVYMIIHCIKNKKYKFLLSIIIFLILLCVTVVPYKGIAVNILAMLYGATIYLVDLDYKFISKISNIFKKIS